MSAPQSFKNHGRFDPPMHFFVFPVLIINFIVTITIAIQHWHHHRNLHLWWIVVSAALVVLASKSRINDLKVQDRIIRLEEQLRLADLLPESQLGLIEQLTIDQFIGLRFASDAEVAALAQRAVSEKLTRKQIKQSITHWRADNHRI